MSAAARSLFVFGVYALLAGAGLALAPALVLATLGFPPAADGWVRVVGVLALCVGWYHCTAARHELTAYVRASVPVRFAFAAAITTLVATGLMPPQTLLFAAVDASAAAWTALALRRADADVGVAARAT